MYSRLNRGIDGFRMDVINFISKDTKLPDGHVRDGSLYDDGMPHFVDGPRIHEFLQEMHREVFAGREGLITRPERRAKQETLTIGLMKMAEHHVGKCCHLFEAFARLFRERGDRAESNAHDRARAALQRWIEGAKESETPQIEASATKLFQDMDAVVAAMMMPYSQGHTEGG